MDTELEKFAETVEDMILQLSYPGFDERSLKLGLPDAISKLPPKTYALALKHDSTVVKLAALRWFQERPGIAKSQLKAITEGLADKDDFVRKESVLCLEKIDHVEESILLQICPLLKDEVVDVRKYTAKALGKLGGKSQSVIDALQNASEDPHHEVRWKIQKALRKLGAYVT